jgi:hypothetical protein
MERHSRLIAQFLSAVDHPTIASGTASTEAK